MIVIERPSYEPRGRLGGESLGARANVDTASISIVSLNEDRNGERNPVQLLIGQAIGWGGGRLRRMSRNGLWSFYCRVKDPDISILQALSIRRFAPKRYPVLRTSSSEVRWYDGGHAKRWFSRGRLKNRDAPLVCRGYATLIGFRAKREATLTVSSCL